MAIKWYTNIPTVLIAQKKGIQSQGRVKIAAFDLDSTLITTLSGRTFAKNSTDWKWWDKNIPKRLEELHSDGYKIVVFSNQNGLNNEQRIADFKRKVADIFSQLTVPVVLYAAMKKDQYRKPRTGMWDDMIKQHNEGALVELDQCFYVGDAAGRQDGWKPKMKKDHSCADRKFAKNINIPFYTPEAFFHKEKEADFSWGDFDPYAYSLQTLPLFTPTSTPLTPEDTNTVEIILFVGRPASGKSTFAKKHLIPKNYTYVNQDTLKTKAKCLKACEETILQNQSVVVDNTNSNIDTRAEYLKIAKKHDVPVRCFYFVADEHLCRHNNYYRHIVQQDRDLIGDIVFRTFKSRFQEPTLDEGYQEIKKINFYFDGDDAELALWRRWYI
ncbi:polynucleotide kinase 3 phosphatase-domain-containing protein [Chlamydoabsidia padenii]|nr:polynucleotide kinase 3 phosphatase-domain-containing protein [Chlamydoabsidia padenii]